jgi:hypothetical protein
MLGKVRRVMRWMVWSLIGAGAMIIGAGWGLLRTSYGRDVVARFVEERVTAALSGSISIGGLSGSFWTGLVMSDVIIRDEDSTEVASVRRVEVRYRPDELWRGGVRVRQLVVRSPHVRIARDSTGELNVARLFDLGGTAKVDTGPPPLVRLNNVTIHDGSADLALDADRPREVRNLNLAVRTIRLSSPTEPGIEAEVTHIAGELSDPAIVLHELTGRVYQHGDSLVLDLPELAFDWHWMPPLTGAESPSPILRSSTTSCPPGGKPARRFAFDSTQTARCTSTPPTWSTSTGGREWLERCVWMPVVTRREFENWMWMASTSIWRS